MSGNPNKSARWLAVSAVIVMLLGLGFGILKFSHSIRAREEMPSEEEMAGRQEYLRLLQELEEILEEPELLETMNPFWKMDGMLGDTVMTADQQESFRQFFMDVTQQARNGIVEAELARNRVLREEIYIRNLADREEVTRQMRASRLLGIGSIGAGILLGGGLLIAAASGKKKAGKEVPAPAPAAPAEEKPDGTLYNEKERE